MKRNAMFGFLGFAVPTLAILIAYPVLVHHLGTEAFGIFILATSVSGAMAFVDLGCSAATLKFVAEDIARGDRSAAADIIVTSLVFYASMGGLVAAVIWLLAPSMASWFSIPPPLRADSVWAFRLAAFQFEAFFVTTVLVSLFKGLHRFDCATLTLSILALLTYGGAAAGVRLAHLELLGVVVIALAANVAALGIAAVLTILLCREHRIPVIRARPSLATFRRMFGFGIFMSINSISGALLTHVQRLVISALLGPAAVTVFTTATTVVSKLNAAMVATFEFVMPATAALSSSMKGADLVAFRRLYLNGVATSALISFTGMAVLFFAAPLLVPLWLNSPIAPDVVRLIRILCIGFAVNAVTPIFFHIINGFGYPAVNTFFFVLSPALLYGSIFLLSFSGLTIDTFAIAFSAVLALTGIVYMVFFEVVFLRRRISERDQVSA